mmetsp:Transcript_54836/g.169809  ORF Transcript_54836/g.169809 Transcript_54836/m.169809 type:complete len:159 (+) Transcript_54836:84-560(+)
MGRTRVQARRSLASAVVGSVAAAALLAHLAPRDTGAFVPRLPCSYGEQGLSATRESAASVFWDPEALPMAAIQAHDVVHDAPPGDAGSAETVQSGCAKACVGAGVVASCAELADAADASVLAAFATSLLPPLLVAAATYFAMATTRRSKGSAAYLRQP